MIDVVLATDMAIHFDLIKSFSSLMEATPDVRQWQDRSLLYRMVVHLADIANPSRPFSLARAWAERVIQEFCEQVCACGAHACLLPHHARPSTGILRAHGSHSTCGAHAQGDKEQQAGLPVSPFCNRATMDMPRAQLNFIDIFVKVGQRLQRHCRAGCIALQALHSYASPCAHMCVRFVHAGFLCALLHVQPTLKAFEGAAPSFTEMALRSLERTIAEWKQLEAAGVKM